VLKFTALGKRSSRKHKRKFNNVTAIEDITLKFRMAILGVGRTIGLWKSTVLRTIAGLEITDGKLYIGMS